MCCLDQAIPVAAPVYGTNLTSEIFTNPEKKFRSPLSHQGSLSVSLLFFFFLDGVSYKYVLGPSGLMLYSVPVFPHRFLVWMICPLM